MFFKCKQVKVLWRSVGLEDLRGKLADCCNAKEMVGSLLAMDESQLRALLLLNNLWHEHNLVREEEMGRSADSLARLCWWQAIEIRNLHAEETSTSRRTRRWERPSNGTLKLNVDGAFRDLTKMEAGDM